MGLLPETLISSRGWRSFAGASMVNHPGVTYGPCRREGPEDYRIYIDKSGLIRNMVIGMDQTIYVEEEEPVMSSFTLEMQMFNFGKDLSFLAFDPADAFDAGKASPEEWKTLGEEIGYNLLGQLFLNPLFRDLAAVFETGKRSGGCSSYRCFSGNRVLMNAKTAVKIPAEYRRLNRILNRTPKNPLSYSQL